MTLDLILSYLLDPFRIGLMVALVLTMARTRAATGVALPLAAGVAFVAYIIPATMGSAVPIRDALLAGVVANVVILAVVLVVRALVLRFRG
ncbi:MAG: hypothetical protein V4712_15445 [Pseudomonadota bacterium]